MRAVNIVEECNEGAAFRRSCNLIRICALDSLDLARNRRNKPLFDPDEDKLTSFYRRLYPKVSSWHALYGNHYICVYLAPQCDMRNVKHKLEHKTRILLET